MEGAFLSSYILRPQKLKNWKNLFIWFDVTKVHIFWKIQFVFNIKLHMYIMRRPQICQKSGILFQIVWPSHSKWILTSKKRKPNLIYTISPRKNSQSFYFHKLKPRKIRISRARNLSRVQNNPFVQILGCRINRWVWSSLICKTF